MLNLLITPKISQEPPAVSFSGGTADRLVRVMARQGIAPVAVFAEPEERIRSFLGVPRAELTGRRMAAETKMVSYGTTLSLASNALPGGFLYRSAYNDYAASIGSRAEVAVKDGKVVIDGKKSVWILVSDLVDQDYGFDLKCHWLWRSAFVAVTPGSFQPITLLKTVSDALGATFVKRDKGYEIAFDPLSHRKRALERFANPVWKPSGSINFDLSRPIYLAAVRSVLDEEWASVYLSPRTNDPFRKGGYKFTHPAVIAALKGLSRFNEQMSLQNSDQTSYALSVYESIDREAKARIEFTPDGRVQVEMPLDDGHGFVCFG